MFGYEALAAAQRTLCSGQESLKTQVGVLRREIHKQDEPKELVYKDVYNYNSFSYGLTPLHLKSEKITYIEAINAICSHLGIDIVVEAEAKRVVAKSTKPIKTKKKKK